MKRLLVVLVVLLPLSWSLAGCGGGGSKSDLEPPSKEKQEAMLKAQMEMMKKSMGQKR